jgi:sugar transferase (PEP-CTERM/EpsH1 system associated)
VRVLFLTHRLPYAPNRGDRVRAYHLLQQLRRWAEVDLVSLVHDDEEASHAGEIRAAASVTIVRVPRLRNLARSLLALPTNRPLTHTLLDASGLDETVGRVVRERSPSVVLAYCSGMARLALQPMLRPLPLVLDLVDVDSAKWAALAAASSWPRSWVYRREARTLARFENEAARHAVSTLVVTEKERGTLARIARGARIEVVQNGVDAQSLRPQATPSVTPTVVFCGVMNYAPNEQGALWLGRNVWPLVRQKRADARLEIVGSDPSHQVRDLAVRDGTITVTGRVPDVRPHLWAAAVGAAPLFTARGIQNKVLEAVAAGLPTVVTPVVREGLPDEVAAACVTADGASAFADAIVALLAMSPDERRAQALRADLAALSWERRLAPLHGILTDAHLAVTRHRKEY